MNSHKKKMVAPIIVTIILILYYLLYFAIIMQTIEGIFRILLGVVPLIFTFIMVKVLIERIKEIKKGEEDDISKY